MNYRLKHQNVRCYWNLKILANPIENIENTSSEFLAKFVSGNSIL